MASAAGNNSELPGSPVPSPSQQLSQQRGPESELSPMSLGASDDEQGAAEPLPVVSEEGSGENEGDPEGNPADNPVIEADEDEVSLIPSGSLTNPTPAETRQFLEDLVESFGKANVQKVARKLTLLQSALAPIGYEPLKDYEFLLSCQEALKGESNTVPPLQKRVMGEPVVGNPGGTSRPSKRPVEEDQHDESVAGTSERPSAKKQKTVAQAPKTPVKKNPVSKTTSSGKKPAAKNASTSKRSTAKASGSKKTDSADNDSSKFQAAIGHRGDLEEIPCIWCLKSALRGKNPLFDCHQDRRKGTRCHQCKVISRSGCHKVGPELHILCAALRETLREDPPSQSDIEAARAGIRAVMKHLAKHDKKYIIEGDEEEEGADQSTVTPPGPVRATPQGSGRAAVSGQLQNPFNTSRGVVNFPGSFGGTSNGTGSRPSGSHGGAQPQIELDAGDFDAPGFQPLDPRFQNLWNSIIDFVPTESHVAFRNAFHRHTHRL